MYYYYFIIIVFPHERMGLHDPILVQINSISSSSYERSTYTVVCLRIKISYLSLLVNMSEIPKHYTYLVYYRYTYTIFYEIHMTVPLREQIKVTHASYKVTH